MDNNYVIFTMMREMFARLRQKTGFVKTFVLSTAALLLLYVYSSVHTSGLPLLSQENQGETHLGLSQIKGYDIETENYIRPL